MKRPRGRPSKASLAAAANAVKDSASSITTSNYSESVSGYSTPLTSNAVTPADSSRAPKLEADLSSAKARGPATSVKVIQRPQDYMLGIDSKKKRTFLEVADSDDDDALSDPSPTAQRLRQDELIARQLQEVLDREMAVAIESDDQLRERLDREMAEALESDDDQRVYEVDDSDLVDSDDFLSDSMHTTTKSKSKGKAKATPLRRSGRPAKKAFVKPEDSLDDEDWDSDFEFGPPAKKRRKTAGTNRLVKKTVSKGKGKGKASALPESDVESSDAIPRAWSPDSCPMIIC